MLKASNLKKEIETLFVLLLRNQMDWRTGETYVKLQQELKQGCTL